MYQLQCWKFHLYRDMFLLSRRLCFLFNRLGFLLKQCDCILAKYLRNGEG